MSSLAEKPVHVTLEQSDMRDLANAMELEKKVAEGWLKRTLHYQAKYSNRRGFMYSLDDWQLAIVHQVRRANGTWSEPDPKWIRLDNVHLDARPTDRIMPTSS